MLGPLSDSPVNFRRNGNTALCHLTCVNSRSLLTEKCYYKTTLNSSIVNRPSAISRSAHIRVAVWNARRHLTRQKRWGCPPLSAYGDSRNLTTSNVNVALRRVGVPLGGWCRSSYQAVIFPCPGPAGATNPQTHRGCACLRHRAHRWPAIHREHQERDQRTRLVCCELIPASS